MYFIYFLSHNSSFHERVTVTSGHLFKGGDYVKCCHSKPDSLFHQSKQDV